MAVIRQRQQVFNKPVGVVRSDPKTATAETWQSISEASQALSAIVYKQASVEAEMAGIKKSMEVDVLDETGNITKAPVNMGSIGTKAFEKNMMQRYENKMRILIDDKVMKALSDNPNDSEDFNTSASIAVGALIDDADPIFQGVLKDYASAKISAGNNTVLRNRNQIDAQNKMAETITITDQMANQAVNAYLAGNNRLAEDLEARIESAWTDLRNEGVATATQAQDAINRNRRNVFTTRIGIELRDMDSTEIQEVIDAFNKGTLADLPDSPRMLELQSKGENISYNGIKNLITNHPHVADNLHISRTLSNIQTDQKKIETANQANLDNLNLKKWLANGWKLDIGKKEMGAYTEFVLNSSGVEMTNQLTTEDILKLTNSPNFYKIIEQQMKLPDNIKFKFQQLANGNIESPESAFAMIEMYQQMRNNISPRGINRNLTSAFGLESNLVTKIEGINQLLTFNSTPEGVAKAMELASMNSNDMLASAINEINKDGWGWGGPQPENVNDASSAKTFMKKRLGYELEDMTLVNEVVDETLLLAGMIGAENAVEMMVETVKNQWIQSSYTVDYTSGGNALQTRYAPEIIFGNDSTVLKDFENEVLKLSGVKGGVLGEDVFVLVDPNSANSNVRYYIVTSQDDGSIQPVIVDDKLVSIELMEYADQISEEYKKKIKENLDFGKNFRSRIQKSWDEAEKKLWYGQMGDVMATF
mgnify:CR=1 FL=1